jgi:SAM-dependent methyltransferase
MARWNRAIAALPFRQGKVLDVGCAFGFATLLLARKGYQTVGVDNSPRYIAWAKRRHPQGEYVLCNAEELPFADASFDGVLLLDVLEHVVDQAALLRQVQRVLKPGGTVILSVPHQGLLSWLDSLNLYARLVCATHYGLFPQEIAQTGVHRHYSVDQLHTLLGPVYEFEHVFCTGIGIAELINVPLLVFCRYLFSWEALYQVLQYVYFLVYLLEDLVPSGRPGYHLMIVARKQGMPSHSADV